MIISDGHEGNVTVDTVAGSDFPLRHLPIRTLPRPSYLGWFPLYCLLLVPARRLV
jgi:hypothetical protein